jgi:type VI protein secretion system component Hcp
MSKFIKILSLYALVLVGLSGVRARVADAAVDIFLKLPELGDCGTSQDGQFLGYMEVFSFGFKAENLIAGGPGGGGATAGQAMLSPLQVTKPFDSCSPGLFLSTMLGRQFGEARLEMRTAGENPFVFLSIVLEQVMVIHHSQGGSEVDDRFLEQVEFSFAKITLIQQSLDELGRPREPVVVCFDVSQNRAC